MDEREAKLPVWAKEMIAHLRRAITTIEEKNIKELVALRTKVQLLERRNGAMEELLTCAATGGHKDAATIMGVLRSYSLELVKEE